MATTVYAVKMYDKILEESKIEIMFYRDKKSYFGPLFWKGKDEKDMGNRVTRYLEEVTIDDSGSEEDLILEVINNYKYLAGKYGIKFYESTPTTMLHWAWVNGFLNEIVTMKEGM